MIQAMSGLMSITGFPTNGPTRVGFAGADVMSGATAALGVASALYQRTHTGKGQLVDVAMIDAVMGYLAQQFTEHLMTGRVHEQAANRSVTRKPTGDLYKTKDGWMVLAVMTEPQFQRLMKEVGRADALADPRFTDWPTRIANDKALHEIIEAELVKETSATWAERFAKADVPAGRVLSIPETVQLDHFDRRTILQTVETRARPDQGRGLRLPPGAWRRLGRPPAGDARPAHRRDPARGGLLGRRHRRHARRQGRLRALLTARSRRRRRQVAGLGRRIATNLGDAAREVGACLRDLGEPRRGLVGEIEMPIGFAEIVARHGLSRRRDMGARLGNPRLVGRGATQLGQPARPCAIVGILAVALGIVGEQPLGFEQTVGRQSLVDGRLELLAVAIALAAGGPQVGDLGAGLGRLGEARHLLVGFLQHRLGVREVAGLRKASCLADQPAGLGLPDIGACLGELLLQGRPCRGAGEAPRGIGQQAIGGGEVAGGDGAIDGGGEGRALGIGRRWRRRGCRRGRRQAAVPPRRSARRESPSARSGSCRR